MELFRQLVYKQTDRQTNGWTLLVPKVAIATEKSQNDFNVIIVLLYFKVMLCSLQLEMQMQLKQLNKYFFP